jgi:antitoxin MazE
VTIVIRKWGNSAAVRIPAAVMAEAGIAIDQPVSVREERGRIVIEPKRKKTFPLRDLVRAIRPHNLHAPVDTGTPVGREIW